jgi:outer membrane receptor protein involved in Fe transport
MSTNHLMRQAIRLTLATAAAVAAYSGPALAQGQGSLGEVVVTGTRIQRQDYEATSPVMTLSADTFDLSGEPQVEKILNEMPQLVPSITTTSNNPSNGGQANINLRGLGTIRTLVLMDGNRLTPSNVTGVIDTNTIPAGLIDSVEILTGGASSVYGSDAVAGVVNVRMKRDFEGVSLNIQNGITDQSDGRTLVAETLLGGNFAEGRGNAVLAMSYDDREEVLAGDRAFGEVSFGPLLTPVGSGTLPEGRADWGTNSPVQSAYDAVFGGYGLPAGSVTRGTSISFNDDRSLFSIGTGASNPVRHFLGDTSDPGFNPNQYSYNFGPVNYLQLPLERKQVAAFARYDIVPDQVEAYARIMFTTYHADQQLAATPISSGVGSTIPITNVNIPADLMTLLMARGCPATHEVLSGTTCIDTNGGLADVPQNLTQRNANFTFQKRTIEAGPRTQENTYDVLQGAFGLRGKFAGDWGWDVYASYGENTGVNRQGGNISRSRIQAAYNNPATYASQGCANFDPFGLGAIAPECARAVAINASNILRIQQSNMVASVTGPLFEMPAGPLQMAIGGEYRENKAAFQPDEFLASGDVVGFNAQQPVSGRIDVKEGFVEFAVPLVADKPMASYIGLDLGYRYSDYNLAGGQDTYKIAAQWNPTETFKFRASYNRAIRAPSISELFAPVQENFPTYSDPCNFNGAKRTGPDGAQVAALCEAQGIPAALLPTYSQTFSQARAFVGGNLDLSPETADTYTYGFAWQPVGSGDLTNNFSMSIDYFDYEVNDIISALTVNSIIGRCYNDLGLNPTYDPNNAYCQLFARDPSSFRPDNVLTTNQNLSAFTLEGLDLQIDWGFPLSVMGASESAGDLSFKLLLTHLLSVKQQEVSTDPFFSRDGTIGQTVASAYPENKAVLTTNYSVGGLQFRYNLRFIDGMDVVNNDAILSSPSIGIRPKVSTYTYHDLSARWKINDTFTLVAGVNNIADKQPPIYTTDSQAGIQSNTDPSTYDVLGRRYFLNLGMKF